MKIILTEVDKTFHNDLLLLLMKHSNSLNHLKVDFLNYGEMDISVEFTISCERHKQIEEDWVMNNLKIGGSD